LEDNIKILKRNISATTGQLFFSNFKYKPRGPNQNMQWKMTSKHKVQNVTEGESEENLVKISSVALLSPACFPEVSIGTFKKL
jgi:hypothetical protein